MIALLPLRGWVGEAMAGQMLAQELGAAAHLSAPVPPCHEATQGASTAPVDATDGTCASCTQCHACTALILPVQASPAAAAAGHALPAPAWERLASAPAAPVLKPPIA